MEIPLDKIPKEYRRTVNKIYSYGTAGFRENESELPPIMFRMGILAVLRSKAQLGASIGVMITASHNPVGDNGVKLIDPRGDMLESSWEVLATELVNAEDADLNTAIGKIIDLVRLDLQQAASVFCAHDTRASGPFLLEAVKLAVFLCGGTLFTSFGLLTTPQLHYIVRCHNAAGDYGEPKETGYYTKFATAFNTLNVKYANFSEHHNNRQQKTYDNSVTIDAANGIGGLNVQKLLSKIENGLLNVTVTNSDEGPLNEKCGADFVKVYKKVPQIYTPNVSLKPMQRCASFDGDADRIVYFFVDQSDQFHLVDGDKIAVLFAGYIEEMLRKTNLTNQIQVGIVQTAYANGNSTAYIENRLKLPTFCVPTGVKYLHKQAESLDVGIYFEANGHGTILFSEKLKLVLKKLVEDGKPQNERDAAHDLLTFIDMINEATGDSMADFLAVETVLRYRNWTISEWDSLYTDLPNQQLKIKVQDRNVVKTTDAERVCLEPTGLQSKVDELLPKYKSSRAFVRPSGTEDIVRIYAEADTVENAKRLAFEVALYTYELAGGIGPKPVLEY